MPRPTKQTTGRGKRGVVTTMYIRNICVSIMAVTAIFQTFMVLGLVHRNAELSQYQGFTRNINEMSATVKRNLEEGSEGKEKIFNLLFDGELLISADHLFRHLMIESEEIMKQNPSKKLHMMEVGMHSPNQCLNAAKKNLQAHCVEPSPVSSERIKNQIKKSRFKKNVKFYQLAASHKSGLSLEFMSKGGTGDHVGGGGIDIWKMTKTAVEVKKQEIVTVKSVAIDDIINNKVGPSVDYGLNTINAEERKIDRLFLLKVDTQGHEPSVFSGLHNSIREHKIDFIMTEYWPKGIDFMNDQLGPETECNKSVEILQLLLDAGYILFSMSILAHPSSPKTNLAAGKVRLYNRNPDRMPMSTLREHCMTFYDFERKYRDDDQFYEMGYWTDILAVRPGFSFPEEPSTKSGILISSVLNKNFPKE